MLYRSKTGLAVVVACISLVACMTALTRGAVDRGFRRSPMALTPDSAGRALYVAETTAGRVSQVSLTTRRVLRVFLLPVNPSGLALSRDGSGLFVTGGSSDGKVLVVDTAAGRVIRAIPVGHTPCAPVLDPSGRVLYVCNRFSGDLSIVDLVAGRSVARIPLVREPIAAALTPDGRLLFVANHLPSGATDGDFAAAEVSVIDTARKVPLPSISLPNGSSGVKGICVSPDGRYVYVTHVLAHYQLPTTQLERGWMNTAALSAIDVRWRRLVNTVLLDDVDRGAANPWGVACSSDGRYLCVAHSGTHEVSVIDRKGLHERLAKASAGEQVTWASSSADDVPSDLSFLVGLRRRVPLSGNGPRGLAISGGKAYVAEYFSDSIGVVDLAGESTAPAHSIPIGARTPMTEAGRGEMIFHDATRCYQNWQSCASCHPGDARADGLRWDLLNDGIGNPKNTKSLFDAPSTPPVMATGVRKDAETAVHSGFRFIQFAQVSAKDLSAVNAYLRSLRPVAGPRLVDGKLSPAALRGRVLFGKAGCIACHPAPLYTNLRKYDLGTGKGIDAGREFDTPSLIEVWRTSPYLHDGRAATIKDVLTRFNRDDRHGHTSDLSDRQVDDLAEFVQSL